MIELPEAAVIAAQINQCLTGKRIQSVIAAHSPHKFAWYHGDPQAYPKILIGKTIDQALGHGGFIEIKLQQIRLLFSDGVILRFHESKDKRPSKHQLLIEFADTTGLSASVQMYGGIMCFSEGDLDNRYYQMAIEKPSPLSNGFDWTYFHGLITDPSVQKLSVKAFLATEQRIPGLGNGTLQDILYNAKLHPKRKIAGLTEDERGNLFWSVKGTLADMTAQGGRDTEKDLLGHPGGYRTKLSKNTAGKTCPVCNGNIIKESYMGGSIYYCDGCQQI